MMCCGVVVCCGLMEWCGMLLWVMIYFSLLCFFVFCVVVCCFRGVFNMTLDMVSTCRRRGCGVDCAKRAVVVCVIVLT